MRRSGSCPVGSTARAAVVRYLGHRGPGQPDAALCLGRRGELGARGIAQLFRWLKTRVGLTCRLSPHSLRQPFARSYLVNGGDLFNLQRNHGHTTLDMVKRYVALADADLTARHRAASPTDRLVGDRLSRRSVL